MEYAGKEKRKNDQRRPFQWWLLVIGFVLGIAVMLLVVQFNRQPGNMIVYEQGGFALTATHIVEQATLMVQDPMHLTATAVSLETAARDRALIDPIAQTATHIVEVATQQAAGTNP
jgi:hypothetical protein